MANINLYSEESLFAYSGAEADYDTSVAENVMTNINGIFGIPYQFTETVDPRPEGSEIGAKYASKILGPMNLLMIVPCKQVFMKNFSVNDKGNILGALMEGVADRANAVEGSGKYYTTELAYADYYQEVNTLCKALAHFMGIQDEMVYFGNEEGPAGDINYENVTNEALNDSVSASNAVMFYVDGGAEQSETFSNDTTESSLASALNGYSDQMNELKFLVDDSSVLGTLVGTGQELGESIGSALGSISQNLTGGMLASLAKKGTSTILEGGKLLFPKLWSNSGFSRSYSFEIKLRSPDHDNVSIFQNIFVPLMHLLPLVLPIGMDEDPNGYKSPFLVKVYDKGFFNIDMGIVTALTAIRGGECEWNDDGLPTQINVSLEVEDLYSTLYLPALKGFDIFGGAGALVKNTAMMDYLSNLGGLNIADVDIERSATLAIYMASHGPREALNYFWNSVDNGTSNIMYNLYRSLGSVRR